MRTINIYPGPIQIGDAVHDDGTVLVGLEFTDLDTGDQATIILSPEAFETFLGDLNGAAAERGRSGSATH